MDEDKDYLEVFSKDDRNRHESHQGKKSLNYKALMKRQFQIQKREACREETSDKEEEEEDVEIEKSSKYGNGKPKKQIKEQEVYVDSDVEDDSKKKPKGERVKRSKNNWSKIN